MTTTIQAQKDEDAEHPIASSWRPILTMIANAIAHDDYRALQGSREVAPITTELAEQIRDNVAAYGETLVELPATTWDSSVAQWMGTRWDVLVDLWTAESGRSDLVLHARVFENDDTIRIEVHLVYVP